MSDLGYQPLSAFATAAVFGLLRAHGPARAARMAVGGSLLARLTGTLIKLAVRRMRPAQRDVRVSRHHSSYSFPSGHVIQYVTLYGFTAYVIRRTWRRSTAGDLVVVGLYLLIILVGPSRIYLGAHWGSDVLGAYVFATLWLTGMIALYRRSSVSTRHALADLR